MALQQHKRDFKKKHHSKKHMAMMNALMNKGKSFRFAHRSNENCRKVGGKEEE